MISLLKSIISMKKGIKNHSAFFNYCFCNSRISFVKILPYLKFHADKKIRHADKNLVMMTIDLDILTEDLSTYDISP